MSAQYPTQQQRERFEAAVQEDLGKSYRHLLRDVHEELEHPDRTPEENVMHDWKRMASLFVRMGEQFERSQGQLTRLTWVVIAVAVLQVILLLFPDASTSVSVAFGKVWSRNNMGILGLLIAVLAMAFLWFGFEDLPAPRRRIVRTGIAFLAVGSLLQLIARLC